MNASRVGHNTKAPRQLVEHRVPTSYPQKNKNLKLQLFSQTYGYVCKTVSTKRFYQKTKRPMRRMRWNVNLRQL